MQKQTREGVREAREEQSQCGLRKQVTINKLSTAYFFPLTGEPTLNSLLSSLPLQTHCPARLSSSSYTSYGQDCKEHGLEAWYQAWYQDWHQKWEQ
jgi:hypothetical protein